MNDWQITLTGIAALPILVPIAINLWVFKTAGLPVRLFLFFLLAGLFTDVVMWHLIAIEKTHHLLTIFNIYSLLESVFFFWFIGQVTLSGTIKTISRVCLFIMPVFWVFYFQLYPLLISGEKSFSAIFDTAYEIAVSFLAGFALLLLAERQELVGRSPYFWLLLGVFFYCFCTFFIMGLLETFISHRIWFLNNIVNLITYTFYSIGLWKVRSAGKRSI